MRSLRAALEPAAARGPCRFPAVSALRILGDAGDIGAANMVAAARSLRALPALRTLHVDCPGSWDLAVSLMQALRESVPQLQEASFSCYKLGAAAALCWKASTLGQLRVLNCHCRVGRLHERGVGADEAAKWVQPLLAEIDLATGFQRLQELDTNFFQAAGVLQCKLPSLTRLRCCSEGFCSTFPLSVLAASAPWLSRLQVLELKGYGGPTGDLTGCSAPCLTDLDIEFGEQLGRPMASMWTSPRSGALRCPPCAGCACACPVATVGMKQRC